jgi:hypothetical protein
MLATARHPTADAEDTSGILLVLKKKKKKEKRKRTI